MESLQTKNLSVGYNLKSKPILKDININEEEGQFISLLGENGSGKSTLLKSIAGLLRPINGEIFIKGKSLWNLMANEKSKLLSVVLTERIITGIITIEELVAMGRYPYQGWNVKLTKEDRLKVGGAIERCELEEIRTELIHEISDGQKQKALIARAVAQDTELLLLDEPTNHLDIKNKYTITKLLKELSNAGKTVIMTTHDIDLATKFCDKMWLINQERKLVSGNPDELMKSGKLDTIFSVPIRDLMGR